MEAEGVVAPDDVAEEFVVAPVVRRVDDPLVLPVGPRVRSRRAERQAERLDEREQLRAALGHLRRDLGERLAPPRLHLGLGGDQLADEVGLERCAGGRRLDVLEPVDEVEGDGVEQRELLLDGHGEVGARLELVAGELDLLLGAQALSVAHGGTIVVEALGC